MEADGKILVLCSGNKDRSPTAELILSSHYPKVKSAGTNISYCKKNQTCPVNKELIDWADKIICMEEKHFTYIRKWTSREKCYILDIPDKYNFNDQELQSILKKKLSYLLND